MTNIPSNQQETQNVDFRQTDYIQNPSPISTPSTTPNSNLLSSTGQSFKKFTKKSHSTDQSRKKPRLVFTELQRRSLHAIFKETRRPSKEMQKNISEKLGLSINTVSNFFMNARRRSPEKYGGSVRNDQSSTSSSTTDSISTVHLPSNSSNFPQDPPTSNENDKSSEKGPTVPSLLDNDLNLIPHYSDSVTTFLNENLNQTTSNIFQGFLRKPLMTFYPSRLDVPSGNSSQFYNITYPPPDGTNNYQSNVNSYNEQYFQNLCLNSLSFPSNNSYEQTPILSCTQSTSLGLPSQPTTTLPSNEPSLTVLQRSLSTNPVSSYLNLPQTM
ncbi:hypothetical protein SNEBB_011438 [Seison nebaliae]|nr:hypothetical protein SNEBB_011438 [Seison nebaliae]